jgi:very-short-patch-repair endonuclease
MGRRIERARELRAAAPDAERILWDRIRNRKLDGFKFRRQLPVAGYFADFACIEARLIVELDGGQHSEQADYDARRTQALESAGYLVLRFWNHAVFEDCDSVVDTILRDLKLARP